MRESDLLAKMKHAMSRPCECLRVKLHDLLCFRLNPGSSPGSSGSPGRGGVCCSWKLGKSDATPSLSHLVRDVCSLPPMFLPQRPWWISFDWPDGKFPPRGGHCKLAEPQYCIYLRLGVSPLKCPRSIVPRGGWCLFVSLRRDSLSVLMRVANGEMFLSR